MRWARSTCPQRSRACLPTACGETFSLFLSSLNSFQFVSAYSLSHNTIKLAEHPPRTGLAERAVCDEDIPASTLLPHLNKMLLTLLDLLQDNGKKQLGKEINAQVNANLSFVTNNVEDSSMHSGCCFIILRNDGAYESAWDDDNFSPQVLL